LDCLIVYGRDRAGSSRVRGGKRASRARREGNRRDSNREEAVRSVLIESESSHAVFGATLTSSASASIVGTLAPRSPRWVGMQIDLHGYHPAEIVFNGTLAKILQQAWEMGEDKLVLIHGHGRNRGISPGFVNTNTGYFGLCIRQALRHDKSLRQWIKHTTLDCWNMGSTSIRMKANPNPSRKQFDCL
jgi:hypothetical protein